MALLRASELDASLRHYFQSEVKRLHQRGSCGHAKIKQLWEMWYQHRGHAANLSLASDRYQVMSVCELPCHCPDQASTFQAFLNWKELSIAEQEHLMTKLLYMKLWKAGEVITAREICMRRLLKSKLAIYERQPGLQTCAYLSDVLEAEATELEAGFQHWKAGDQIKALEILNRALRLRPKDFSRRGRLPLETESEWAVKAGLLANAQQLEASETMLQAEVWYRRELSLHLATMQLQMGLAAGFKKLGDFKCRELPIEAINAYHKATKSAIYVAQDYLTLAQTNSFLIGTDVGTEGLTEDVKLALAEYYSVLGFRAIGRRYLTETCSASLAMSLGELALAWRKFRQICKVASSHAELAEAHQGLGELCEADGNYERAWLEHRTALAHWGKVNKPSAIESQQIRLHMLRKLLRKDCALPEHFSSILNTLKAGQSLLQESHVIVRNVQLWDDMGGELLAPSLDCYCHDCEVLMADAFAASDRMSEARALYEQAAERYDACSSLNSFFAWKRLGDFCIVRQKDIKAGLAFYERAQACLAHCTAKGCWTIEQLYKCSEFQDRDLWKSLEAFFKSHEQPFAVAICKSKVVGPCNWKEMIKPDTLTTKRLIMMKSRKSLEDLELPLCKTWQWNADTRLGLQISILAHKLCMVLRSKKLLSQAEAVLLKCVQYQQFYVLSQPSLKSLRSVYS